jgi:hypothetical protein
VRCTVDPRHAAQLTREHVTAAVHYIAFDFTPDQIARFGDGATLVSDHPAYLEETFLGAATLRELWSDLD